MTNLQAIKAAVQFPLDETSFELALINRELTSTDTYSKSSLKLIELCKADLFSTIISTPNIVEGGYQLSHSDKKQLSIEASRIYTKWGETFNIPKIQIVNSTEKW